MKYMLLIYLEDAYGQRSLAERQQIYLEQTRLAEELTAKGVYLKGATISATMTPGIKLDVQEIGARHK